MTDLTRVATDLRCDILRMIAEAKRGDRCRALTS